MTERSEGGVSLIETAVVTDARLRVAVNIIRSLGRRGIRVVAAESRHASNVIGFRSRYVSSRVVLTGSHTSPGDDDLRALLQASEGGVLVPAFTPWVMQISKNKERIRGNARALVPDTAALLAAHDKAKCAAMAESLGVPAPQVYEVSSDDIHKKAAGFQYPVIVKYRSGEDLSLVAHERYSVCYEPEQVIERYGFMHRIQPDPVVQRYIDGSDWGAAVLFDGDSRLRAAFTYKALRLRPRTGGPTVYAESIWRSELVDYAVAVLSPLKWKGMAMLDFREDRKGDVYLLEINPRFWGSMALSIETGVDFPYLYYLYSLGREAEVPKQKEGVRLRFFPQDFLSIPEYAKASSNPAAYVLKSVLELMNPYLKDGLLSLTDPMPGLSYLIGGVRSRHAGH